MAVSSYYSGDELKILDREAMRILGVFQARGYVREEPSLLQPAEIFLDRSGEEIRRRTFTLTDPSGRELALRPDLTIPICKHAVETGKKFPARICYHGPVFRHQASARLGHSERPAQFFQAGAELLGLGDAAAGEAEILSLTLEALAGLKDCELLFGDLALFGALVDALELPPRWRARLKRHFWRAGYVETLLARLSHGVEIPRGRAEIEALLAAEGDAPPAGRERDVIITRALEMAQEAARLKPDPAITGAITKLFRISGPATGAVAEIRALLKTAGIKLEAPMAALEARLNAISALGLDPAKIRFTAHFGRNMEYYTGFVFEVWGSDADGPIQLAGGGRYDTLMESLGAPGPVSAIGCAIRTERVLAARDFMSRFAS